MVGKFFESFLNKIQLISENIFTGQFKQETMAEKENNPYAPVKNQRNRIRNNEIFVGKNFQR